MKISVIIAVYNDIELDQCLDSVFKSKNIEFIIKPNIRFKGQKGEQSIFFIKDPSGNVLEFKSFKNDEMIFDN